jgi:hypothetical protein
MSKKQVPVITLRIHHEVVHYDFWTGLLQRSTAGIIRLAAGALANKIHETLKFSKAEKDKFQMSRFDLLIPTRQNSMVVLRFFCFAKFRSKARIEEPDIRNAIISSVDRFDAISKRNPDRTVLITAELRNDGDELRLLIHEEIDFDLDSARALKEQIDDAKSGKTVVITF